MNPVKIVIVGEVESGKSWLWQSYFQNRKPTYVQTVFDNYGTSLPFNGHEISINLFELCGEEAYSSLRKISYQDANVVILCVSVMDPEVTKKSGAGCPPKLSILVQELQENCKKLPVIVVGTKKDSRESDSNALLRLHRNKMKPLKYKDLVAIAKKFKISTTLECSALTKEGLDSVFNAALKMGLKNKLSVKH